MPILSASSNMSYLTVKRARSEKHPSQQLLDELAHRLVEDEHDQLALLWRSVVCQALLDIVFEAKSSERQRANALAACDWMDTDDFENILGICEIQPFVVRRIVETAIAYVLASFMWYANYVNAAK